MSDKPRLHPLLTTNTISIWGAYITIGITLTVFGPTIPHLIRDFSISMGQAGLFVSSMAMGRMLSVIASGVLTDNLGRKPVMVIGTSLLALGLVGIASLQVYVGALVFAVLAGIGHAMVDTSGSASILDLHPGRVSQALNITHVFFGVGSLVGPVTAGLLLSWDVSWRTVYYGFAAFGFLVSLNLLFKTFPKLPPGSRTPLRLRGVFSLAACLLGTVMFIYSGVGHSINTWINTYMLEVVQTSVVAAAGALAVYNLGIILGRIVCSVFTERIGYRRSILIMSAMSLLTMVFTVFAVQGWQITMGVGLTGFFFGGLFPLVIAIAGELYPHHRGTITGVMIMLAALGGMIVPGAIGFSSEVFTLQASFRTLSVYVLVLVIAAVWLNAAPAKPPTQPTRS